MYRGLAFLNKVDPREDVENFELFERAERKSFF